MPDAIRASLEKEQAMPTGPIFKIFLPGIVLAIAFSFIAATLPAQEGRKLLKQPAPTYPEMAKRMHLSGTVKVQVVIGPDGLIKETKVVGGHPILVEAALEALRMWKYAPASGETTTTLEFSFHPQD
jgi:TonB family protein